MYLQNGLYHLLFPVRMGPPLTFKDINKIAEIIYDTIFKEYPTLSFIYNYFIEMSRLLAKLDLPVNWVTPNGAPKNYTKLQFLQELKISY